VIGQKYRLERLIANGSFGAVYECMHIELNRARAIKLLHPEFVNADPHGRYRLRREALTACSFDHPNLVRIYDFGTNVVTVNEAGSFRYYDELYIVMELSRGQTLRDFLKLSGPVPLQQCIAIGIQIAEGLAEIHAKGVIYRDLKPANTMLTFDHKGELLVKIVDFGTVKLIGQPPAPGDLDLTGSMFIGSPNYAPPESCMAKPVDQRGDLYSLGLILYEMIAGRRAFNAPDFPTLLNQHAYASPPPLIGPPKALVDLVMRALSKDPADRPQTAGEFVRALQALEHALKTSEETPCFAEAIAEDEGHFRIDNKILGLGVLKGNHDESTRTRRVYHADERTSKTHIPAWFTTLGLTVFKTDHDESTRMRPVSHSDERTFDVPPTWFTTRSGLAIRSIAALLMVAFALSMPSSRSVKLEGVESPLFNAVPAPSNNSLRRRASDSKHKTSITTSSRQRNKLRWYSTTMAMRRQSPGKKTSRRTNRRQPTTDIVRERRYGDRSSVKTVESAERD
jgi:serine/threonine protein kinase